MSHSAQWRSLEKRQTGAGAWSVATCTFTRPRPTFSAASIASITRARSAVDIRIRSWTTSRTLPFRAWMRV